MQMKHGIPVFPGVAIGEAFVIDSEVYRISQRLISQDPEAIAIEKSRYKTAVESSICELRELEKSTESMTDISIIFQGHRLIIEDAGLQKEIIDKIENFFYSAEYAISHVMWKHSLKLKAFTGEFYTRRISDLEDIENRLLRHLLGINKEDLQHLQKPVVLIAPDLTPSQTAVLPREKILGFATDRGGRTSHAAIVARSRCIPAVVALVDCSSQIRGGDSVIIDGRQGVVIIDPDQETLAKYTELQEEEKARQKKWRTLTNLPVETTDAYKVTLRANIEDNFEVKIALENGASGIGLYRTEFIYIFTPNPNEEDQYNIYKNAAEELKGKKMIIRTFDLGADKDFGDSTQYEQNPFLGCRSIRMCFENLPMFKTQLRAILRASVFGDVEIMFPMISSLEELQKAKLILEQTKSELRAEDIPYNEKIKVGIMIEIPSAAVIADILAPEVDFFSIGTNDLIQYTLAVDRINERVAYLYKAAHPAIFRLIHNVVEATRHHKIKVCVCGEMASDIAYLIVLMGMGLRDFSMSPGFIPSVKEFIRSISMHHAVKVSQQVMMCHTHDEAVEYLKKQLPIS